MITLAGILLAIGVVWSLLAFAADAVAALVEPAEQGSGLRDRKSGAHAA